MRLIIKADEYKVCPRCLRLFPKDCNYCPDEKDLIELIDIEFK